jgi:hypothetical protein
LGMSIGTISQSALMTARIPSIITSIGLGLPMRYLSICL